MKMDMEDIWTRRAGRSTNKQDGNVTHDIESSSDSDQLYARMQGIQWPWERSASAAGFSNREKPTRA